MLALLAMPVVKFAQRLVRFPCCREDDSLILAEAADQPIAWDQLAQGPRIDIAARNMLRAPNLAGRVSSLCCPLAGRQVCQLAFQKDKTLAQVVVQIPLRWVELES